MKNFLIEGVSGTGKTSVCRELQRRGYHAVNGDVELAYQGVPETGQPVNEVDASSPDAVHEHHIWRIEDVKAMIADHDEPTTFFCGGARNSSKFIDLFDGVFVLHVDVETLHRRLDARREDEFGGKPAERELILRLHRTGEDTPANGIVIDATASLSLVVDEILRRCEARTPAGQ